MKKIAFNFNQLTGRKQKYYYLVSFLSLIIYCFVTTYYICVYKDIKVYMQLAWCYSFFVASAGSLLEACILSLVFRLTNKDSKFLNLFIGLGIINLLCMTIVGSVFDILSFFGIVIETIYGRLIIFLAECYLYHSSLKLSYKKYSLTSKILGLIILLFNLISIN